MHVGRPHKHGGGAAQSAPSATFLNATSDRRWKEGKENAVLACRCSLTVAAVSHLPMLDDLRMEER